MERSHNVPTLETLAIKTIYKYNIPTHELPHGLKLQIDMEYAASKGNIESVVNILETMYYSKYKYQETSEYSIVRGVLFLISQNLLSEFKIVFNLIVDKKIQLRCDIDEFDPINFEDFLLAIFQITMFIEACQLYKLEIANYISTHFKKPNKVKIKLHSDIGYGIQHCMDMAWSRSNLDMYIMILNTVQELGEFEYYRIKDYQYYHCPHIDYFLYCVE